MKSFLMRELIVLIILIGFITFSCSENRTTSDENLKNKKLIDSLSIEKKERTLEARELKAELDSLKKLRDSLKANSETKD